MGRGFVNGHRGIDIKPRSPGLKGQHLIAPVGGEIVATYTSPTYGNVIVLDDGSKHWLFAHLARIDVEKGTFVQKGVNLGIVGITGAPRTAPMSQFKEHVHVELRTRNNTYPSRMDKESEALTRRYANLWGVRSE